MNRRLSLAPALALLLLSGCATAPRFQAESAAIQGAGRDMARFAREGWTLPLDVRVYLSNGYDGRPLPPEQQAREEALALAQLEEVKDAYERAAFDVFVVDVRIEEGAEREAWVEGGARRLVVRLPAASARGAPQEAAVLGADALLEALAEGFAWDATERWYARLDETPEQLLASLEREVGKLDRLEEELALECRRLELLAGSLTARAEAAGRDEVTLTASETSFARSAQLRATFALHRVLNTIARWRAALEDPDFPWSDAALVVLGRARLVHEAYLGWLLNIVVGGRTAVRFWEHSFWHRTPLYKALDAPIDLERIPVDGVPRRLPAGSIGALLALRCDLGLGSYYEEIDGRLAAAEGLEERLASSPLREELEAARARMPATRRIVEERTLPALAAWKELWDARIKDTFQFPFYEVVALISTIIGDAHLGGRPPAIDPATLTELEEDVLRPGDVLLVRQDGYLSNAFLPGFWTHAIVYLGPRAAWTGLELPGGSPLAEDPLVREVLADYAAHDDAGPPRVIEAISEGVVFSSLEASCCKDYVLVLRPQLSEAKLARGIRRALACHGRPYDFDFDFATDERVVCTEVVYRAYDPYLDFRAAFDAADAEVAIPGAHTVMGRLTLPANDLARYALYMQEHPEPDEDAGYPGRLLEVVRLLERQGTEAAVHAGERAVEVLRDTVDR